MCVLVLVLLSVLFVLFMVPMFVFTGRLSVGTETVGVKTLCMFVVRFLLFGGGSRSGGSSWPPRCYGPPNCLPNSAGWPMGPSAPLCVPLNELMVFCQESWCCEVWFCFYMSGFQGTSCVSFTGPSSLWPLYGWLLSPLLGVLVGFFFCSPPFVWSSFGCFGVNSG